MGKEQYKQLGIGAGISFIVALFGVISRTVFYQRYEKGMRISLLIDYSAGIILTLFAIIGVVMVFYFCLKVVTKAIIDIKNNNGDKKLISIYGFLASFLLIIMFHISEYSIWLLYDLPFEMVIAEIFDIPSYIGIVTFIFFYFSYLVQVMKKL